MTTDRWQPISSAPERGEFLVWLSGPALGLRIHSAKWTPNVKTIGGCFHFDMPKATHWMPLPEPPNE